MEKFLEALYQHKCVDSMFCTLYPEILVKKILVWFIKRCGISIVDSCTLITSKKNSKLYVLVYVTLNIVSNKIFQF